MNAPRYIVHDKHATTSSMLRPKSTFNNPHYSVIDTQTREIVDEFTTKRPAVDTARDLNREQFAPEQTIEHAIVDPRDPSCETILRYMRATIVAARTIDGQEQRQIRFVDTDQTLWTTLSSLRKYARVV